MVERLAESEVQCMKLDTTSQAERLWLYTLRHPTRLGVAQDQMGQCVALYSYPSTTKTNSKYVFVTRRSRIVMTRDVP
jgi:hypothetical protein